MINDRSLAAIVFSDIYQFTIKMGNNEGLMMRMLHEHNRIFDNCVGSFKGRIVKSTGDGFLMEFRTATAAVKCCLRIQSLLKTLNEGKTDEESFQVRIGIHLGEVIHKGNDIFGSGVNIASRIEPQAEPGGIAISRDVYNSIKASLPIKMESMGLLELKHVNEPHEIFKVSVTDETIKSALGDIEVSDSYEQETDLSLEKRQPLPEYDAETLKKRVAVLPFKVLSPRSEDDHYSEGFAEALIFGIGKEKRLYVHNLHTVQTLGRDIGDMHKISSMLGVGFITRGVIQRAGAILQIQVELIRANDQAIKYSEMFTCSEDDIFTVQNKAVKSILYAIVMRVSGEIEAALIASSPKNPLAGKFYLQGKHLVRSSITWDDRKKAISLLEKAVKFDGSFALARAALSQAYVDVYGRWQNDETWLEKARTEAEAALEIDPELPGAYLALGIVHSKMNELDEAEMYFKQVIELRNDEIGARKNLYEIYIRQGQLEQARIVIEEAISISNEIGNQSDIIDLTTRLARLDGLQGFYLRAIELYGKALSQAKDVNEPLLEANTRMSLGHAYKNIGKIELALKTYEQSLEMMRTLKDRKHYVGALNNIGMVMNKMGRYKDALARYEEGRAIAQSIGDLSTEASILSNLGKVYSSLGRFEDSVKVLTESVNIWRGYGHRIKEANALILLAASFCDMGDHSKALSTYRKTHQLVRDTGDFPMLAYVLLNIGEIYDFKDDFDNASYYYDEAESAFEKFDASHFHPYLHLFRGRLHYKTEQFESAISDFERTLNDKAVQPTERFRAELYLALCRNAHGDELNWEEESEKAVKELETIGSHPELVESLRVIGGYLVKSGNSEKGFKYLKKGYKLAQNSKMKWETDQIQKLMDYKNENQT